MSSDRYIRQVILDKMGPSGQERLSQATVLVIGCGGLGSIAAPYLAGAGVGKLILVDGDKPHVSNLHRQVFFSEQDTSTKAHHLAEHIERLNPEVEVVVVPQMITKENIKPLLELSDIVLECTDDMWTKYLVNDYCHLYHVPLVYGAIHKYNGYVSTFDNESEESIHLRDIFPEPNLEVPTCAEVGVLGTLAGLIGLLQANEALKYISQCGPTLSGKLLTYDILTNDQMTVRLKKAYTKDKEEVIASHTYVMEACSTELSISLEEVRSHPEKYQLINIQESYEADPVDLESIAQPLTEIDVESWQPHNEKIHVFYCAKGQRSRALVDQLIAKYPELPVLSLIPTQDEDA